MANKKIKVILAVNTMSYQKVWISMIEGKIRQAADNAGWDMELRVVEEAKLTSWDYENDRVDLILVSPKMRYGKKGISEKAEPLGIIVKDIDPTAYGMADGEKIFGQVMEALKQKDKKLQ